ncbi:hypothetical protein [Sulfurimonas sp.]|uniref:hypothetical protein n=1 Tax=Sulfurimonas sp. TaxID=2022749 RepID=UPI00261F241C|nr:hypothetical protein [Sulfurimonas sp.]
MQQNKDGERKLYRLFGLSSLALITAFSSLYGEDFEDFKRVQNTAFAKYKDANDNAFEAYLKKQWQEYNAFASKALYKKEKPKVITPASQREPLAVGPAVRINVEKEKQERVKAMPKLEKKAALVVHYFGTNLSFIQNTQLSKAKFYPPKQKGVLNFFSVMAASDYQPTLLEIKKICDDLKLNDWGLYLLVQKLSQKYFSNDDDKKLYSWFILNKLGYNTKVGLKEGHIVLLSLTKQQVYATPGYRLAGEKFYNFDAKRSERKSIYTYEQNYPNAVKALDFSLPTLPLLAKEMQEESKTFRMEGKNYTLSYRYNKNLINFMNTYPQVDYQVYFDAPLEEDTYRDIALGMKPYLDGKKANIALNFVLRFVQSGFEYERDKEQFGKEKVMFAQETLFYTKSDCEDRAVLYAKLVKKLFGIGVVGVKYPNHMATALYIPLQGDSVKLNGRRFVVADPTFINANVGESMPKYKSIIPESFIVVKN